jgi:hypothetical protein
MFERVLTASSPNDDAFKTLIGKRVQDGRYNFFMDFLGNVDIATTKAAVFGRWTEWKSGKDERIYGMLVGRVFSSSQTDSLDKPGIEVDGKMRSLLLSASGWHNCKPIRLSTFSYLFEC